MTDYLKMLSRKGEVTILKRDGGKTIVAIESPAGVLTLEGAIRTPAGDLPSRASVDQLLSELYQLVQDWPDKK